VIVIESLDDLQALAQAFDQVLPVDFEPALGHKWKPGKRLMGARGERLSRTLL